MDEWLLESTTLRVRRAGDRAGRRERGLASGADHDAALAGVRDRALSPAADSRPARRSSGRPTSRPRRRSRFGPAGGPLQVVERDAELTRRHVVALPQLAPATAYEYQWESDGKLGDVSRFTTSAGLAGRLLVRRDRRLRHRDARRAREPAPAVGRPAPSTWRITTGDNAQIYGTEDEYRRFVLGPLRDLIATKPFWPSVGNHDYYNLQNYLRFFALPNGGLYYSFTYGGVLFLVARLEPLRRAASGAGCGPSCARRQARCKVAYFHHPLWSSGRGYRGHTRHLRRSRFVPILRARRRRPGAQRPRAELRALQAAALGPAQPARASSTS